MNNIALVTGASSGIGRDLARIHAEHGGDLVIVARRQQALENLRSELESAHGVTVVCVPADLTQPGAVQRVYDEVKQQGVAINVLINNAGFGGHGKFHERAWADDESMIQLNVTALCAMTHAFLPDMLAQKQGKILNVASTAGFLPGPLQAVYYATKAFVLSFSQAIAEELSDVPITVTALCPGPVDTGFIKRAGLEGIDSFENAADSRKVAAVGYRAMQKGKLVAFDDWKMSLRLTWLVPLLPRWLVLRLSRNFLEKS